MTGDRAPNAPRVTRALSCTSSLWSMSRPAESVLDGARQLRRWSMSRLAGESGLAVGTIQEALSGLRGRGGGAIGVRPSVGTLLVLARTLELSPDQFRRVGREDAVIALDPPGRGVSTFHGFPSRPWSMS